MSNYDSYNSCRPTPKKPEKKCKENSSVINNNNINVSSGCCDEGANEGRKCTPKELIKNGGFEESGQLNTFAYWEETDIDNIDISRDSTSYEFRYSAEFESESTGCEIFEKTAVISQSVTVTPGCYLQLSFADNFYREGSYFDDLNIRARVYYSEGMQEVNLIDIEIDYGDDQDGLGFVFHQKISDNPIPLNVTAVTVEFYVEIIDSGSSESTIWLLDGVSLRSL